MSMKPSIDKRLVIRVTDGTVTERMWSHLSDADKKGRSEVLDLLRSFSVFGYMVQELGGGVIDAFQSMERNGELEGMDTKERAEVLISMLERISGKPVNKPVSEVKDEVPVLKKEPEAKPTPSGSLKSLSGLTSQFKATSV